MTILGPVLCILKLRVTKCGTRDYIAGTKYSELRQEVKLSLG